MSNECKNGQHVWVCLEVSGDLGEKRVSRELLQEEIALIVKDSSKASEICSNGRIVCSICGTGMFEPNQGNTLRTNVFDDIKRDLSSTTDS